MVVSEELIMIEAFDRFSLRLATLMPPDHYMEIRTRKRSQISWARELCDLTEDETGTSVGIAIPNPTLQDPVSRRRRDTNYISEIVILFDLLCAP